MQFRLGDYARRMMNNHHTNTHSEASCQRCGGPYYLFVRASQASQPEVGGCSLRLLSLLFSRLSLSFANDLYSLCMQTGHKKDRVSFAFSILSILFNLLPSKTPKNDL
jgi:hypothetical protein